MTRFLTLALLVVTASTSVAQAPQSSSVARLPSIDLPADLDRVLRDYEKFWRAGDVASLAGIFTEDGFASRPGGWVRGREAIKEAYGRMAGGDLKLRALAYAVSDTVGYIVGGYAYGETAATRDNGKFILTLRRKRGSPWMIASDLDSAIR